MRFLRYASTIAKEAASRNSATRFIEEPKLRLSRLSNGVLVATDEAAVMGAGAASGIARVALVVPGARYEPAHYAGITHFLRLASQLDSTSVSSLGLTRSLQQMGASLTCNATREHLIFQVESQRDFIDDATVFLSHVSTRPAYKHWQVEELMLDFERDIQAASESQRTQLLDALHEAAYRNTLNRQLVARKHLLYNFEPPFLHHYVRSTWTPERTALVSVGLPHARLLELAERFDFARDSSNERHTDESIFYPNEYEPRAAPHEKYNFHERPKYGGGERRVHTSDQLVQAALVTDAPGLNDASASLAFSVLSKLLSGSGVQVKHGSGSSNNKLNAAALAAAKNLNVSAFASALHLAYSDSSLVGAYTVAHKHDIGPVLRAVRQNYLSTLRSTPSESDLERARAQLLAEMASSSESLEERMQSLCTLAGSIQCGGKEAASNSTNKPLALLQEAERRDLLGKLSTSVLQEASKRLLNGKPTLALVGELSHAPYLDELN